MTDVIIHVPKCMGTLNRAASVEMYDYDRIYPVPAGGDHGRDIYPTSPHVYNRVLTPSEVSAYDLVIGHYPWNQVANVTGTGATIALLRHPVERFVSHLQHIKFNPSHPHWNVLNRMPMDDVLSHPLCLNVWNEGLTRYMAGVMNRHIQRDDFKHAVKNVTRLDAIGIQEYPQRSLALIGQAIGRPFPKWASEQIINGKKGRIELTDEQRERVRRMHVLDLQLYGFALERFHILTERAGLA